MKGVLGNIDNKYGEMYIFTLLEDPDHKDMSGNVAIKNTELPVNLT